MSTPAYTSIDTAGQYVQPLDRSAFMNAPAVSGYATLRLSALLSSTGSSWTDAGQPTPSMRVTARSLSDTQAVTIALLGSNNYSVAKASKTTLDSFTLAPGGSVTRNVDVDTKYVEMWCTSGNGDVQMQFSTQIPIGLLAFDKLDASYPHFISQPSNV